MAKKIYVASSWRNTIFDDVVIELESRGFDVYDFKSDSGFHWSDVDVPEDCSFDTYQIGLRHQRSIKAFHTDYDALYHADVLILILPCNRSAHLELGFAVGRGKPTAVLFDNPDSVTPELMYKMVSFMTDNFVYLLNWLGPSGKVD